MDLVWLYCPATRTDLFSKAMATAADAVVFDLEDAVLSREKERAREELATFLDAQSDRDARAPRVLVRVNGPSTPWFDDDVAMLKSSRGVAGVRLSKVTAPEDVLRVADALPGIELHPAVETAAGLVNLHQICALEQVASVALGEADLRASLRLASEDALDHLRVDLVCAMAAAGKRPPMGSAYLNVRDDVGLAQTTRRLAALGYVGRTAIHPRQIGGILEAFRPAREEVELAAARLKAARRADIDRSSGAFVMSDGTFIDVPVVQAAQLVIDLDRAVEAALRRP